MADKKREGRPAAKEPYRKRPDEIRQEAPEETRENDGTVIAGRNAVIEALKSGRGIECVYMLTGERTGSLVEIEHRCREAKIPVKEASRKKLDELSFGEHHQGVVALAQAYAYAEVEDILAKAREKNEPPFIVLLENIQDPHNLGAVIRTAEACGVHGIIISRHNAVGLTAAVVKTAAGACEYVPVAKVGNMVQTIEKLQKEGLWVAAADMDGEEARKADLTGPIALLIGSEHKGVGRLVKEKCDRVVKIPMRGNINSLNASVAAGILMYEIMTQRGN